MLALLTSRYRENPRGHLLDTQNNALGQLTDSLNIGSVEEWKRLVCYRVVTQLNFLVPAKVQMVTLFLVLVWGFCLLKLGGL